jgi:hypothetical protein
MNVQQVSNLLTETVTIAANRGLTENAYENNMFNVARQIAGVSANNIRMEEGIESVIPGKPSLTLRAGNTGNIHYFAVPEGKELAPLLDAVSWLGKGAEPPDWEGIEPLMKLTAPTHLMILMAAMCPHCPAVVRSALSLAVRQSLITLAIVDAVEFSDLAERYKVKSTPTIIINDGFTLVGQVKAQDLVEHIVFQADPDSFTATLESMINSGRAEDAAGLICKSRRPEALLPLYRSKEFSTRMGVLVAMEEALEQNPRVLDPIVEELTKLLFHEEVGLRGDTADLLGNIGNPAAVPALRKAAEDPDEDVRDAVKEALERLEQ